VLCLGLISSMSDQILDLLVYVEKFQRQIQSALQKRSLWLFVLIIAVVIFESLSRIQNIELIPIIFIGLTVLITLHSWYRAYKEGREHQNKLKEDRAFWIENASQRIFIISLIPIACARALSFLAVLNNMLNTADGKEQFPGATLYMACSLLLLIYLYPKQEHFIIPCKRCASFMSRAFKSFGVCPRCETKAYSVARKWGQRKEEPQSTRSS